MVTGHYILSSSRDGKVKKVNIVDTSQIESQIAFSSDIALRCDENFVLDHGDSVIDMSVDGHWLLSAGNDARLLLWNITLVGQGEQPLTRVMTGG